MKTRYIGKINHVTAVANNTKETPTSPLLVLEYPRFYLEGGDVNPGEHDDMSNKDVEDVKGYNLIPPLKEGYGKKFSSPRITNTSAEGSLIPPGKFGDDCTYNPCRLFVGGIGQGTAEDGLRAYFSTFGTVNECVIVCDRRSGKSRGFGFVTFQNISTVENVLATKHKIDHVIVECRLALTREEARETAPYDTMYLPNKLFVGGIPESINEDEFRSYFSRFGAIQDVTLAYDKNKHRPRGFGFILYADASSVARAVGPHQAFGKRLEAKRAVPRQPHHSNRNRSSCPLRTSSDAHLAISPPAANQATPQFPICHTNRQHIRSTSVLHNSATRPPRLPQPTLSSGRVPTVAHFIATTSPPLGCHQDASLLSPFSLADGMDEILPNLSFSKAAIHCEYGQSYEPQGKTFLEPHNSYGDKFDSCVTDTTSPKSAFFVCNPHFDGIGMPYSPLSLFPAENISNQSTDLGEEQYCASPQHSEILRRLPSEIGSSSSTNALQHVDGASHSQPMTPQCSSLFLPNAHAQPFDLMHSNTPPTGQILSTRGEVPNHSYLSVPKENQAVPTSFFNPYLTDAPSPIGLVAADPSSRTSSKLSFVPASPHQSVAVPLLLKENPSQQSAFFPMTPLVTNSNNMTLETRTPPSEFMSLPLIQLPHASCSSSPQC